MKKPRSLNQILMSGLGKAWMAWPPRNEVKRRAKVEGKAGWYRCEKCGTEREKIDIDHIEPVVKPQEGFTSWDDYIKSKFVDASKLQALCKDCHKAKSKAENKIRAATRATKKEVTSADLDEFAKRFKGATDGIAQADSEGSGGNKRRVSRRVLPRKKPTSDLYLPGKERFGS